MPEKRKSGPRGLPPSTEVSHLTRAHGITRDQARRLMNKIGNDRTKLDAAARILKARSLSPKTPLATNTARDIRPPVSTYSGEL
jgi:hypothetical protein